jgi:signal transduction histidine kinase
MRRTADAGPLLRGYRPGVSHQVPIGRRLAAELTRISRRDLRVTIGVGFVQLVGTLAISHRLGHNGACTFGPCHAGGRLDPGALLLLVIGPLALLGRRRFPEPVLAVVFAATVVYAALGYPAGPVFLSLIVAFVNVVVAGRRSLAVLTILGGWAVFLWLPSAFGRGSGPSLGSALGVAAWLTLLLAGAELLRGRRERVVAARVGREQEARHRAEEERLRIARELHDVLAHNISLINVQSGVALHLLDQQPEQARSALTIINEASADALREVRSVLGILRGVDEQVPRAPTAGLARLGELVKRSAAAGVEVEVEVDGEQRPVPTSVDLAAFRIVQESLTNVARHSGADAARVRLGYGEHELTVRVQDDGAGRPGRAADGSANGHVGGGGNGIAGMRERAVALGGVLDAGPVDGRGFRVTARLPLAGKS